MTLGVLAGFFLFVLAAVSAAGYVIVLRPSRSEASDVGIPIGISREHNDLGAAQAAFVDGFRSLGEWLPVSGNRQNMQRQLVIAGYRWPSALSIFLGIKAASALLFGIVALSGAMIKHADAAAVVLAAVCGMGFGYLIPD